MILPAPCTRNGSLISPSFFNKVVTRFISLTLLAGYVLSATSASAASSTRPQLGDPAWLPDTGQIFSYTTGGYSTWNGNANYASGASGHSYTYYHTEITQELGYGVNDRFVLTLSDSYTPGEKEDQNPGSEYKFSGFQDPTIGADYRVMDERYSTLNVDVELFYSPNVLTAKAADLSSAGSIARGNNAVTVDVSPSYVGQNYTVRGVFGTTWYSASTEDSQSLPGTSYKTDSYWQYHAALQTQLRLNERFAFNASIIETIDQNRNATLPSGLAYTYSPGADTQLAVGFQFRFIPNKLLLSVLDTYEFEGNDRDNFAVSSNNETYSDLHGNTVAATLEYVF
jgi:hypothetical protein